MFKYKGCGCYRFIDELGKVIYVGSAKNIDRRIHSHFSKSGHLPKKCYDSVAIIEVCKCQDYATALALEQYLINKYKPKYNKKDKDHNINSKAVANEEYYEKLENWKTYYKFKEYDKDKIEANKKDDLKAMFIAAVMFILVIGILLF